MTEATAVWFITGCSRGLGYELAKLVIAHGWRVVVTARDKNNVAKLLDGADERVLALDLDVTAGKQIENAVAAAKDRFGRIDVLVNNAGYGYMTSVEEGEDEQIRALFDLNVFGLFALTRAVLPTMREQRSGHIINITSVAGLVGMPVFGYYCATKHAVEGLSKVLLQEVGPLGIKVTCVEPGPLRTDWFGRALQVTPSRISDYADVAGKRLEQIKNINGQQRGDPARAAEAIVALTAQARPPRNIVFGTSGFEFVTKYLHSQLEQIKAGREIALATDFPAN